MSKSKIKNLEKEILKHKELYYKGFPEISDQEYDELENDLRLLDPSNRVLQIVGVKVISNKKIKHDSPMLSLDKCYEIKDLLKWKKEFDLISTLKIDGSSCSLLYKDGKFELAKTRGDGSFGEDISNKTIYINNIPRNINEKSKIEIRGEIYCTEDNFIKLKKEMKEVGLPEPSSKRNIVAGILGRKEYIYLAKYLSFCAFELVSTLDMNLEEEKLYFLKKEKFDIPDYFKIKSHQEVEQEIKRLEDFLENGDYLVDGLVFTINNLDVHEELGSTNHHPKYKMAFKLAGEKKQSVIKSIEWNVSRNGVLTPVANIEPVDLSGAMISNVTLHNLGIVQKNNLKEGDQIEIIRSGEVIPKYLKTIKESKKRFSIPKKCPSCDEKVNIDDIRLKCINEKCPDKVVEEINHYIKICNIEDLSDKRIREMISKKIVSSIPDLYDLNIEKLLTLDKTKEKLANKLFNNIQEAKKIKLSKFLSAVGIDGVAENSAQKIIDSGFNTIDKFRKLKIDDIIEIDGFAEKSAEKIVESLRIKSEVIDQILNKGISFTRGEEIVDNLNGKSFCITGKLSRGRSEIEKDIKKNGGKVTSSVSKNLNYLICNEESSNSSKYVKAEKLNISIITELELMELINGENSA